MISGKIKSLWILKQVQDDTNTGFCVTSVYNTDLEHLILNRYQIAQKAIPPLLSRGVKAEQ
jgi:hypothetical protein